MTVAITREELGAAELRREAGRCRDARAARRMLALALVLEGSSRAEAARHAGMERQTLRGRARRYDAEGLGGARDPDRDGGLRWGGVDLRALTEARCGVRVHERSDGKVLRRLGFARLSVRP